jgi:hypothetical protein
MTTLPQVYRSNPRFCQTRTQRYLSGIFNERSLNVTGFSIRDIQYIDKYASRATVLTEAQRLGWKVFVLGSRWLIIPQNRSLHQFKWQLTTVQ